MRIREMSQQVHDFVALCRYLILADGRPAQAAEIAASERGGGRVADVLRAVAPLTAADWPSLIDYKLIADGFIGALTNASVFDSMLSSMQRVPLGPATTGAVSAPAVGYYVGERGVKPVTKFDVASGHLDPVKAISLATQTAEMLRFGGRLAANLLQRQLVSGAAGAVDSTFISTLLTGAPVIASSGSTNVAVINDLRALLGQVPTDSTSELFLVAPLSIAQTWCTMLTNSGDFQFPDLTVQGGTVIGIPLLISDNISAGTVMLADAFAIVASSETPVLDTSRQAMLQLEPSPDSPPTAATSYESLWQMNKVAAKVERQWSARKLRASAVAALSGVSGNSP